MANRGNSPTRNSARSAVERRQRAREMARIQQQKDRRRRLLYALGSVVVVLAVIAAIVAVKLGQSSGKTAFPAAPASLVSSVTSVPTGTLNSVGGGGVDPLTPIPANAKLPAPRPLTSGGKPEFIYLGAEYCPYCAAERWAIVNALSRFGTWSGLGEMESSATDVYPDTHTFSFRNAHLSSRYVTFYSAELQNRDHKNLQTPNATALRLAVRLYGNGFGYPFLDIANLYADDGAQYLPSVLHGLTWTQIATDMQNSTGTVGRSVDGAANTLTAAICQATGGKPANVCSAAAVVKAQSLLKG
jgi:hypothetical protein